MQIKGLSAPLWNKRLNTGAVNKRLNENNTDVFISFKSEPDYGKEYSKFIIDLAEKYMYCKNFYEPLTDEIWEKIPLSEKIFNHSSANELMSQRYFSVMALITKMQDGRKKNDEKTKDNTKIIGGIKGSLTNVINERKDLKKEIENQKIEDEKIQESLNELLVKQKKWNYYTDNLTNGVVKLIQSERENKKENPDNKMMELDELNGIMLKGLTDENEEKIIKWIKDKTGCEVINFDFADKTEDDVIDDLMNLQQETSDKNERTFVHIKNLEKFTEPIEDNDKIIGKLKRFFQCCSKKYNCILISRVEHPEKIDEDLLADQRFVIKLDADLIQNDKKMDVIQNHDGYKLKIGKNADNTINLYLGDSGYNDKTLWIDSNKNDDIISVIARLEKIKQIDKFKNIKTIQCPQPEKAEDLPSFYRIESRFTYTGVPIYEKVIESS